MKRNNTLRALLMSCISLLLCCTMLVGSTFAWFTDSASTGVNKIVAGNLDVELEYKNNTQSTYAKVTEQTNVFMVDTLWEPGHVEVVNLKISNAGSLALQYQLGINVAGETESVNMAGEKLLLSDHIKYAVLDGEQSWATSAEAAAAAEAAANAPLGVDGTYSSYVTSGNLTATGDFKLLTVVVYMPSTVGNEANHKTGAAQPDITLGITLNATQYTHENDSFGNTYDAGALLPDIGFGTFVPQKGAVVTGSNISVKVPASAKIVDTDGNQSDISDETQLTVVVEPTAADSNFTVAGPARVDAYEVTLVNENGDKVVVPEGESFNVELNIGAGRTGSIELYHYDELVSDASYNATTGIISFTTSGFSPYTVVERVETKPDTSWYDASATEYTLNDVSDLLGFAKLVNEDKVTFGGKTVKLGADMDLAGIDWTPICNTWPAHWVEVSQKFTFDGCGHTISNMTIDYVDDGALGFFGYVLSTTAIKNVNFENAAINAKGFSYTYSGVLAGKVHCALTVEKVNVTNSKIVSGWQGGGIIGYTGDTTSLTITECSVSDTFVGGENATVGAVFGLGAGLNLAMNNCTVTNVDLWTDSGLVEGGLMGYKYGNSSFAGSNNTITDCVVVSAYPN